MKILKNELFIPIITCFLALVTFISLYSLPKAKASQSSINEINFTYLDILELTRNCNISIFDDHYSKLDINSSDDLAYKKIFFSGSTDYYVVLHLENNLDLYINSSLDSDFSLALYDCNTKDYLDSSDLTPNRSFIGFSFDMSALGFDTLKIQNIKYFSKTTNEEVSTTNISIFVSNVHPSIFTFYERVEPTYFTNGNIAHYDCPCHYWYYDENFLAIEYITLFSLLAPNFDFEPLESYDIDTSTFVPLEKNVDMRGKTFYFSKDSSSFYTNIYFNDFYITVNPLRTINGVPPKGALAIVYSNKSAYLFPDGNNFVDESLEFGKFSFDTSFPDDVDLVIQDIKHFSNDGTEIDSVGYDILISTFVVHDFSEWIDEIPATETTNGVKGHYACSHCDKYFNENYAVIKNLEIPIKTDKPNNDSSIDSGDFNGSTNGVPSGASCSSASIYGIFGILIVFSFVAFAISHITKRKKSKRK